LRAALPVTVLRKLDAELGQGLGAIFLVLGGAAADALRCDGSGFVVRKRLLLEPILSPETGVRIPVAVFRGPASGRFLLGLALFYAGDAESPNRELDGRWLQ